MYTYKVEQAIRAAAVLHKDQVRKGDTPFPYVTHLYAVALIVSEYTKDENVIVAALLHDSLEDSDYTSEELADDFGGNVRDLVLPLTEPDPNQTDGVSWKNSKTAYVKRLKKAPENSLLIAAADKMHNMRCMVEDYYDDHSAFLANFSGTLDDRMIVYQDLSNLFNRRLDNSIIHEFNNVFDEYKKFIEYAKRETEKNKF